MKRVIIGLSILLTLCVNGQAASAQDANDGREASFMPPVSLVPAGEDNPVSTQEVPAAPEKLEAVDLGQPVSSKPLADVDPETAGLLDVAQGGLGASMWKDTPRAFVDKFLQAVGLPTESPTLNDLARRMLLSTAALPEGAMAASVNLTTLRVHKLIEIGAIPEAWRLVQSMKSGAVGEGTLRDLAQAALVGADRAAVCARIPDFMKEERNKTPESAIEWQKALVVCKMQANDSSAVQLGLDLLREQKAPEDSFMLLATRNYMGRSKTLPRRLTPLDPLNLAVLRQLDLPLPSELFARPAAGLIPELLLAKAKDEKARLKLAESAAARGLLSAGALAEIYKSAAIPSENIADVKGPFVRAALYQKAQSQTAPQDKVETARAMLADASPEMLAGSFGLVVAGMIEDIPVTTDYNVLASTGARLMAFAGNPEKAMAWVKLAEDVRGRLPEQNKPFLQSWPIFVLSGLIGEGAFANELKEWLDQTLKTEKPEEFPARQEAAGKILLLLSVSGFKVPEEAWMRVLEPLAPAKRVALDAALEERLRLAGQAQRKGETVLLTLLRGEGSADAVRALRQAGMEAESRALAREEAARILAAIP